MEIGGNWGLIPTNWRLTTFNQRLMAFNQRLIATISRNQRLIATNRSELVTISRLVLTQKHSNLAIFIAKGIATKRIRQEIATNFKEKTLRTLKSKRSHRPIPITPGDGALSWIMSTLHNFSLKSCVFGTYVVCLAIWGAAQQHGSFIS